MQYLPSFSLLRSFEAAAKHQSFTLAAEELRVTQGAISRQVKELEGFLGVALFRKAGRGVVLTSAGKAFAARLNDDLGRLRQTVVETQAAGEGAQTLTIATLPTFGSRWLAPRLPRFCAMNPDVQIVCHNRSVPFDLAQEGIDVAIHFGSAEWVGGELTQLCSEDLVAVASPLLIDQYNIQTVEDAISLPLLHLRSRSTAWQAYFQTKDIDDSRSLQGAVFDQFSMLIATAVHGMGAAIVPTYLIESELAQGTLAVLDHHAGSLGKYHLVRPKGVSSAATDVFKDWIVEEVTASTNSRIRRMGLALS
jgi:DNA-binding transcriptional LysR family regulator